MGVIYQHIKDDELPVLLRVCYKENNHDMEQTAHDLESIDMLLAVMKAKSLINRNDRRKGTRWSRGREFADIIGNIISRTKETAEV